MIGHITDRINITHNFNSMLDCHLLNYSQKNCTVQNTTASYYNMEATYMQTEFCSTTICSTYFSSAQKGIYLISLLFFSIILLKCYILQMSIH